MSNFAIEGLISGFDTTSIIEAMLDIQVRGPIDNYEAKIEEETEKYSAYQGVNAAVLSLDIAVESLKSASLFSGKDATSSDDSVVSVSASNSAELGSFSVKVNNLATTEQISSKFFVDSGSDLALDGEFIINGKAVAVETGDTLSTIATKINATNSGAQATVVQTAANQNKLVISSSQTGANQLELREVGSEAILENLGLVSGDSNDASYDYTVNSAVSGPVTAGFTPAAVIGSNGESFSIIDASGQTTLDVTLSVNAGATLTDIANDINTAATAQGSLISASVITDSGGNERILFESDTGIATQFSDPDNYLSGALGLLNGVQSEEFTSTTDTISEQLNITGPGSTSFEITDADSSDTITVNVDFSTDSLQDIADNINTAAAGTPGSDISAQIITVDGISRLEISSATGRPQFTNDPDKILNTLGIVDSGFSNIDQRGENSQITYNGVKINRETNLISDVVEGITLGLSKESTDTININVDQDLSDIETAVENYVTAYNDLNTLLEENTFYDSATGDKGLLFGESTIRQLQSSLANALSNSVPNLPNTSLSDLNDGNGVSLGKIKITDRNGVSSEVNLLGAKTVQDVLDTINADQTLSIKASVSNSGNGIVLTDESGGTSAFKVEEVNDGTTASDLGLLRQIYSDRIAGSPIGSFGSSLIGDLGISLNSAGGLDFDSTALSSLLNTDPDQVENLLQATNVGFAAQFTDVLDRFTQFSTGLLDSTTTAITDRIESYTEQIERFEDRADTLETTLRRRFTSLETSLAQSQQLGDYISQQLTSSG